MRTKDGDKLDPSARVEVVGTDGWAAVSTVGFVSQLLAEKSLPGQVRSVLPGTQDPARAESGHLSGYYEALERQHFDPSVSQGSVFHDVRTVEGLVKAAVFAGVDLSSADDRGAIASRMRSAGATDEEIGRTFRDGVQYVTLNDVLGWNCLVDVSDLVAAGRSDVTITATRAKPGVPQSFVVPAPGGDLPRKPKSTATLVIGPDPKDPAKSRLYTAHRGDPVASRQEDPVDRTGDTVEDGY